MQRKHTNYGHGLQRSVTFGERGERRASRLHLIETAASNGHSRAYTAILRLSARWAIEVRRSGVKL